MQHRSDAPQQPNSTFPLTCFQFGLAHTKIQVSRGFHSGSLSDVEESTAISFCGGKQVIDDGMTFVP